MTQERFILSQQFRACARINESMVKAFESYKLHWNSGNLQALRHVLGLRDANVGVI